MHVGREEGAGAGDGDTAARGRVDGAHRGDQRQAAERPGRGVGGVCVGALSREDGTGGGDGDTVRATMAGVELREGFWGVEDVTVVLRRKVGGVRVDEADARLRLQQEGSLFEKPRLNFRFAVPKQSTSLGLAKKEAGKKIKINRSDITLDPGGHRSQRPCAQGRTYAKQDQPQASAPGQNRTQRGGGATTHGLRTRQAGKSVPTQTHPGNGVCTPQPTPQEGTVLTFVMEVQARLWVTHSQHLGN